MFSQYIDNSTTNKLVKFYSSFSQYFLAVVTILHNGVMVTQTRACTFEISKPT